MEAVKGPGGKKNFLAKTWERCKSGLVVCNTSSKTTCTNTKQTSSLRRAHTTKTSPPGCFSVYVGEERQRFAVKTQIANHPLFKTLLQDAETEYGYNSQGPLLLPCDVDLFYKVLAVINDDENSEDRFCGCGFAYGSSSSSSCSPSVGKGHGSYRLLTPPRLINMNHF